MNKIVLVYLFLSSISSLAQRSAFMQLGVAQKKWVLAHPFKAKIAYQVTQQALVKLDSLGATNYFEGNIKSGSKADAVRHAYWMVLLSKKIGKRRALKLGKAYERKNKRDFKKGSVVGTYLPDLVGMQMDLKNNAVGVNIENRVSSNELLAVVLSFLEQGKLVYIKQNEKGEFLDKNGQIILYEDWSGKWKNDRVVIPTSL
ncbi:MAG: hypothetical protein QMC40_07370 [Vicingaceae bacterium]|tara:strand:- start:2005 stop:2607 length:603 start_codon:yes stop_codon:yes gene_type:complete